MRTRMLAPLLLAALLTPTMIPVIVASADPAPLGCAGVSDSPGPLLGDGATPGDAGAAATLLTYGCYDARLDSDTDVDGYRILATPATVSVTILQSDGCARVTWLMGPPPSNAVSRWLCSGDAGHVTWSGLHPMRLQLWHGPHSAVSEPTSYGIRVWPGA